MDWQPIETAPKGDGKRSGPHVLVYRPHRIGPGGIVCVAAFEPCFYMKHARPYWYSYFGTFGKQHDRDTPPTHWMPLPEPPK